MENLAETIYRERTRRSSIGTLLKALTGDTKELIRQEVQLAKTEISEKITKMGRDAISLAVGGFVAYAGVIVLLVGLGWLVGYALSKAGLAPMLSAFIGLGGVGLLVAIVGVALLMKGISAFKKESLAPQRTIQTIQDLRGTGVETQPTPAEHEKPRERPSSAELQDRVQQTEARMGENLHEIGRRLTPSHVNRQVKYKIQQNPYRSGAIAAAVGFLGTVLLKRKLRHHHNHD